MTEEEHIELRVLAVKAAVELTINAMQNNRQLLDSVMDMATVFYDFLTSPIQPEPLAQPQSGPAGCSDESP